VAHPDEPVSDELELASKVLQELEPAVREFASEVTGSTRYEVGELLAGKFRLRRYRSEIKLWKEAQQIAKDAGLPPSAVPVKVIAPLLAYAVLEEEDDDDMRTRWANLLANAGTESPADVPPSFPELLRQLEPLDAAMLDLMFDSGRGYAARDGGRMPGGWQAAAFDHHFDFERGTVTRARLENLVRLGLAFHPSADVGELKANRPPLARERIGLSELGVEFVRACRPPEPPELS
jgi:hypothetical protein